MGLTVQGLSNGYLNTDLARLPYFRCGEDGDAILRVRYSCPAFSGQPTLPSSIYIFLLSPPVYYNTEVNGARTVLGIGVGGCATVSPVEKANAGRGAQSAGGQ